MCYMSHIFKLVRATVDGVKKHENLYVAAESFGNAFQSPANLANRLGMESRDDLHNLEKLSTKTVHYAKVRAFWNRLTKILEIENLDSLIEICHWKSIQKKHDLKKSQFFDLIFSIFIRFSMNVIDEKIYIFRSQDFWSADFKIL